jgi:hypothetical protein
MNESVSLSPSQGRVAAEPVAARLEVWTLPVLAAAGLSFVGSVRAWFLVDREVGLFVGLWVPSILALGGLLAAARR